MAARIIPIFPPPSVAVYSEETEESAWIASTESPGVIVRETSPRELNARWISIRMEIYRIKLAREFEASYPPDLHDDHKTTQIVPKHPKRKMVVQIKLQIKKKWDKIGVWFCRSFHPLVDYQPGSDISVCPSCHRKYAAPWYNPPQLPEGVYFNDEPFIEPLNRTRHFYRRD
jgi:hypothetical protein